MFLFVAQVPVIHKEAGPTINGLLTKGLACALTRN